MFFFFFAFCLPTMSLSSPQKRAKHSTVGTSLMNQVFNSCLGNVMLMLCEPFNRSEPSLSLFLFVIDIQPLRRVNKAWLMTAAQKIANRTDAKLMKYKEEDLQLKPYSFVRNMKTYLRSQNLVLYGRKEELWTRIMDYQRFPISAKTKRVLCSIKRCIKKGLRGASKRTVPMRRNKRLVMMSMLHDKDVYKKCHRSIARDKDVVRCALATNGTNLRMMSKEIRRDDDLVYTAVCADGSALLYASRRYRVQRRYVSKAAETWGSVLRLCPAFRDDAEIMKTCVRTAHWIFHYASDRLKEDADFVREVVAINGNTIRYVSQSLITTELLTLASKTTMHVLSYYPIAGDIDAVVMNVIDRFPVLSLCSPRIRATKSMAMRAVAHFGISLRYCSDALRDDEDVVLQAIRNNGLALVYASMRLQLDHEIALESLRQSWQAVHILRTELFHSCRFQEAVITDDAICTYVKQLVVNSSTK